MKKTYRRHSEEFKKEVVDYSLNSNKSIAQICRDFGISANQFYEWRKKLLGNGENKGTVGDEVNGDPQD